MWNKKIKVYFFYEGRVQLKYRRGNVIFLVIGFAHFANLFIHFKSYSDFLNSNESIFLHSVKKINIQTSVYTTLNYTLITKKGVC